MLMARDALLDRVSAGLGVMLKGFYDVVPPALVSVFDHQELELLLCGLDVVDVDDWIANTEMSGFRKDSNEVVWFWKFVRSLRNEQRLQLLQFVTGTSHVPAQGFSALQG